MKYYKVSTTDNEWSCIFCEETINRAKEYGACFSGETRVKSSQKRSKSAFGWN